MLAPWLEAEVTLLVINYMELVIASPMLLVKIVTNVLTNIGDYLKTQMVVHRVTVTVGALKIQIVM